MEEQIDVIENFKICGTEFEAGKGYVVVARRNGKIVAIKPVLHWFHADNTLNKLRQDADYRKKFIENYGVKKRGKKQNPKKAGQRR